MSIGLGVYYSYRIKQNAWILINGSGFGYGDQKLVVFIDVPTNVGIVTRISMYELVNNGLTDNWYFYETTNYAKQPSIPNPEEFDLVIFIASNSNKNNNWDDFEIQMTTFNDGVSNTWSFSYHFGDKYGNYFHIGI
ncbi:MAG: hypothetical protein ACFFDW_00795 [Candidatus Thorarchaeota archaeon]